jgi:peptidoglycan/xylan/chitin deacetylase (PgdA/CDA1 family)
LQDGHLALTFDDGPYNDTNELLDVLDQYNVKATFFICGNNLGKGRIDDDSNPWPSVLQRMHSSGHQMASHSWTHQDLALVNSTIRQKQVVYNEMAFRNLFGFFPTYFRPPYGDCKSASGCLGDVTDLGYHVVTWNIDTKDYLNDDPNLIQNSKDTFSEAVSNDSSTNAYVELSHDIHYETVVNLTAFMIDMLIARGYKPVPVGKCLGDPEVNWYRNASDNSSTTTTAASTSTTCTTAASSPTTTSSSLAISSDGTCGGTTGNTCQGSEYGNCCSPYSKW